MYTVRSDIGTGHKIIVSAQIIGVKTHFTVDHLIKDLMNIFINKSFQIYHLKKEAGNEFCPFR